MTPVSFVGVAFDPLTPDALLAACLERAHTATAPGSFAYVVTPNADHVVRLADRPDLAPLYAGAWLRVNDSRVITRLARLRGLHLPACPGSDLTATLFTGGHLSTVTLIGGGMATVARLRRMFPQITVHHHEPPHGLAANPDAIAACAAFTAEHPAPFVLIAVGSPQQEMVAQAIAADGRSAGVGLCIGASLEFLAGTRRRAPLAWQKAGFEWAYRLLCEPRRLWRRYLVQAPRVLLLALRTRPPA